MSSSSEVMVDFFWAGLSWGLSLAIFDEKYSRLLKCRLDLNQLDCVSLVSQSQQFSWILDQWKVWGGVGGVGLNPILVSALAPFGLVWAGSWNWGRAWQHVKDLCESKVCDVKNCQLRHSKKCSYYQQFN